MNEDLSKLHLTDELFVNYAKNTVSPEQRAGVERHLSTCLVCSEEVSRMRQLSTIWESEREIARLEKRIDSALNVFDPAPKFDPIRAIESGLASLVNPFVVSLRPLMRPQGAYGETKAEEETSTLEFFVTQEGKIVEGLRGLLKRVNREYYVRIFAVEPGARSEFGDRKALISISDDYQDRPILNRRIDIGVTVLLGTDFRLSENSCLAVEMLPPYRS